MQNVITKANRGAFYLLEFHLQRERELKLEKSPFLVKGSSGEMMNLVQEK